MGFEMNESYFLGIRSMREEAPARSAARSTMSLSSACEGDPKAMLCLTY